MSDPTETVPDGPTADFGSPDGPTADSGSRTETVPDGPTADSGSPDDPTADSGSTEWTQRFLNFGCLSGCAIAEIAWLTVLAWAALSFARWLFS